MQHGHKRKHYHRHVHGHRHGHGHVHKHVVFNCQIDAIFMQNYGNIDSVIMSFRKIRKAHNFKKLYKFLEKLQASRNYKISKALCYYEMK
jgi:hypothetical protein